MLSSLVVLATALASIASATTGGYSYGQRHYTPLQLSTGQSHVRRQFQTCEQTYGNGSVECGHATNTMCYNPSLGQTCCPDNGYCDAGQYCAPVSGYCCLEGEGLEACAKNAGFILSTSGSATVAIVASSTATVHLTSSKTLETPPSVTASTTIGEQTSSVVVKATNTTVGASTAVSTTEARAEATAETTAEALPTHSDTPVLGSNSTTAGPKSNGSATNASSTPFVQVSAVGRREQWTLIWMTMGIGLFGVIMATF